MTSTERVVAALSGKFADRRAWTATLSLYGARLRGAPPERYYRDPRLYAEGQFAVAERFEPDLIFGALRPHPRGRGLRGRALLDGESSPQCTQAHRSSSRLVPEAGGTERVRGPRLPRRGSEGLDGRFRGREARRRGHHRADRPAGPHPRHRCVDGDPPLRAGLRRGPARSRDRALHEPVPSLFLSAGAAFVATPAAFANPRILKRGSRGEADPARPVEGLRRGGRARLPPPRGQPHAGNHPPLSRPAQPGRLRRR